ncbi:MAG: nucleoside monophosphate kinase [Candidatus Paceibacterota bacterium]|jgi:adenylate kinase
MQPQTFIFFGIVGSGKGTQVKLLMEYLKGKDSAPCVYIGTGEIFRAIAHSTDLDENVRMVKELLDAGRLIPDEMTNQLVLQKIDTELSAEKHCLFDGYPRTVSQSEVFEGKMKEIGRGNIKIIYLELSKEEATKRNLLRGRHDDTAEGLAKRFDEYVNKVVPAMNYFKGKNGYTIYAINGEQSVEDVHREILEKINL